MDLEAQKQDHDNLITLIEQVKTLAKSHAEFHAEVRANFQDLRDNYAGRLTSCEDRLSRLEICCNEFKNENLDKRMVKLEKSRIYQNTMIWVGIGLLSFLATLLIYHIGQKVL